MTDQPSNLSIRDAGEALVEICDNLEKVIRGKRQTIEMVVCCLAASGHVLLEDIPGTGKTTLAKSLARTIDGSCKRVQFTPDLLPADIVGGAVFNPVTGSFLFKPGPIFTNVLVADEINRASSRTQSALIEAMGEQQVSIDGETHFLESPFICIATQNPIEFYGTYQLPETQLDRFMAKLSLGYLGGDEELLLLEKGGTDIALDQLSPVVTVQTVSEIQKCLGGINVDQSILRYVLQIIAETRRAPTVQLGISTRGSLHLVAMSKAYAMLRKREYVIPEDIIDLVGPVLSHRLILDSQVGETTEAKSVVLREMIKKIDLPR